MTPRRRLPATVAISALLTSCALVFPVHEELADVPDSAPLPVLEAGAGVGADAATVLDSSTDGAAASTFCARQDAAVIFCADFDEDGGVMAEGWDMLDPTAGALSLALETDPSYSPPHSLRSALDGSAGDASCDYARAWKVIGKPTGSTYAAIHLDMQIYLEPGFSQTGVLAVVHRSPVSYEATSDYCQTILTLGPGYSQFENQVYQGGVKQPEGDLGTSFPNPDFDPQIGTWIQIGVDVLDDHDGGSTLAMRVGQGAQALAPLDVPGCVTGGDVEVYLGLTCAYAGAAIDFDDVTVTAQTVATP